MSPNSMQSFISTYFCTSSVQMAGGVLGALDNGDCIFASIKQGMDDNGNSVYHAICIIGYSINTDGSPLTTGDMMLRYMDPATGSLGTISLSDFNSSENTIFATAIAGLNAVLPPH